MPNPHKRLPSGDWLRPTTNKVREALIASLLPYLEGARVLDLFAGTGSLGMAALNQGAQEAVFVESDPRSCKFLTETVQGQGHILVGKLPQALSRVIGKFDIVIADPPYNFPQGPETLKLVQDLLKPEAIVIFEHHHKENYPDSLEKITLYKRKRFGETALSFWKTKEDPE